MNSVYKWYKVMGIERTGTNYLNQLLMNRGFKTIVNQREWKHGVIKDYSKDILYIIIIKNPYTWFTSITKYKKIKDTSLSTVNKLFGRYNLLYKNHLVSISTYENVILCRYEDLLVDLNGTTLSVIGVDGFEDIISVYQSKGFDVKTKPYYIKQIPIYGKSIIDRVSSAVDWDVINQYDYFKI